MALDVVAHTVYWRRDTCNKINQKTVVKSVTRYETSGRASNSVAGAWTNQGGRQGFLQGVVSTVSEAIAGDEVKGWGHSQRGPLVKTPALARSK